MYEQANMFSYEWKRYGSEFICDNCSSLCFYTYGNAFALEGSALIIAGGTDNGWCICGEVSKFSTVGCVGMNCLRIDLLLPLLLSLENGLKRMDGVRRGEGDVW